MKKLITVILFLSFLFVCNSCSKDDSVNEPDNKSDVAGNWGINMEQYSGNSLIEKLDVYLTIDKEINGYVYGTGTVSYYNSGTTLTVQDSVFGAYLPDKSPNIYITISNTANSNAGDAPPFTFVGDWDTFGENFKGKVTIYSGNQLYFLDEQSFYKRGN